MKAVQTDGEQACLQTNTGPVVVLIVEDSVTQAMRLQRLLEHNGYLSGLIIDESEAAPSSGAYQARFGSLLRAYRLVGFTPDRDYRYLAVNRELHRMHPEIIAAIIAGAERGGATVERGSARDLLTINGEFTASLTIARCRRTQAGSLRWHIRLDVGLLADITVAIRMDATNQVPLDYYLLPRLDMSLPRLRLAQHNGVSLDSYRFDTLDTFYELTARWNLMEVA